MKKFGFVDEKKSDQDAQKLLDRLQLKIDIHKKVIQLSVAEQQLVEIAKSLSYDCELLILDEPTSALADSEAEVLFGILEHLREQGVAIIYVSHRMSDIKPVSYTHLDVYKRQGVRDVWEHCRIGRFSS